MQISEFRDLLANDGFAATFQTMGQYRTELLRSFDAIRAQADARPVAWQYRTRYGDNTSTPGWHDWEELKPRGPGQSMEDRVKEMQSYINGGSWYEIRPLYTHPEASAPGLSDDVRAAVRDAVAQALGDAYDCTRVWEAWSVGTMSQDDFALVAEDDNRVAEIADAAIDALTRASAATVAEPAHSDDAAVDRFAAAMKAKLAQAREKGRGGWQQCDPVELSLMLREHVEKGDPRDVANFCMFLWNLGKPISDAALPYGKRAAQQQAEPGADEQAAFEAWQSAELPSHQRSSYTAADVEFNCYEAALAAWLERAKRANSRENSAPLHLGACITDGKLYVTAMQSGPSHTTTVVATAELDMDALSKGDCHTVMIAAQSGQRAGVAEGWRFYSADFSITAHQPSQPGYVMLIRDEIGYKKWHSMDEAAKEEIPLFITGRGVTFEKALLHANENAIAAAPTQQQEGGEMQQ